VGGRDLLENCTERLVEKKKNRRGQNFGTKKIQTSRNKACAKGVKKKRFPVEKKKGQFIHELWGCGC